MRDNVLIVTSIGGKTDVPEDEVVRVVLGERDGVVLPEGRMRGQV